MPRTVDMEHIMPTAIPELPTEYKKTFVDRHQTKTYFALCGDDRGLTAESIATLASAFPEAESPETALRYYGGLTGFARVSAAVIGAQYGEKVLKDFYPKDFVGFMNDVEQRIRATSNIIPGLHSAEANEHSTSELDLDSEKGLGCAYAAGAGAVTALTQNETLVDLFKDEEPRLFSFQTPDVTKIVEANALVNDHFFPQQGAGFGVTRSDFVELGAPVAILAGAHASAKKAVVGLNYTVDKISRPTVANKEDIPFYNNDVTQVAEAILRAFPDLDIDPRLLLGIIHQDIRATREALASSEGLHAGDLELRRYGDPEEAIAYLKAVKTKL